MAAILKDVLADRVTQLSELAAAGTGIEIVEVEVKGAGRSRLLRIYIDRPGGADTPGGVSHGDCQLISERLGQLLDDEDVIPNEGYTLEVSSPGVERRLSKPRDFERVVGQKIRLAVHEPIEGRKSLEGKLSQFASGTLEVEIAPGNLVHVPLEQIRKANLKFEW
jgi:ribosome maturation factor RimP